MAAKVGQSVQYQEAGILYAAIIISVDTVPVPEQVGLAVFDLPDDANPESAIFRSFKVGVEEETVSPPVNGKWNSIPA